MQKEKIKSLASEIYPQVVADRRHIHASPELSFQEHRTAAFIRSRLDAMNIPWKTMADTGTVGLIRGDKHSDEVIALRADIDALPIHEPDRLDYASKNQGVMHACGHDAHTASLLGTAFILQSIKSSFGGTVKLIFQPAEEKLPGGAGIMIREGVLEDPSPTAIIGQHVVPTIDCGKIGIKRGTFMASMDELTITIHGRGGHGAQPHKNINPVLIAAHILIALQQIVAAMSDPLVPTVLAFGKVIADGAINIIPDTVFMQGTFRTMNEAWREKAHTKMRKIAEGIAESMGGRCTFDIAKGYPFLINDERLTDQVASFARDYLGEENVIPVDSWMAAEDFAYYSQARDACFYVLGIANPERGITASLHSPDFRIDENALAISTGLMAYIAVKRLGN